MNSYRFLKAPSARRSRTALVSVVALAGTVALATALHAQQSLPAQPQLLFAEPPAAAPEGAAALMESIRTAVPPGASGAPGVSSPAAMPLQGPGGMAAMPASSQAGDAATRMNLDGAPGYLGSLQDEAQARLAQMTQGVGPAPASGGAGVTQAGLSPASIGSATAGDLEEIARNQRQIMLLTQQVQQAELAVKLWGTLYNNEHAQAWREREEKETAERVKAEQERAARQALAAAPARPAQEDPVPVVTEVQGGVAILSSPRMGEVTVRVGSLLPGGMRVLQISTDGVQVERNGQRIQLGFGVY